MQKQKALLDEIIKEMRSKPQNPTPRNNQNNELEKLKQKYEEELKKLKDGMGEMTKQQQVSKAAEKIA